VQGQRLAEGRVERRVRCELRSTARGAGERPGLALSPRLPLEGGGDAGGVIRAAESQVGLDQIGGRPDIGVADAPFA
jgi:hypothetical protein